MTFLKIPYNSDADMFDLLLESRNLSKKIKLFEPYQGKVTSGVAPFLFYKSIQECDFINANKEDTYVSHLGATSNDVLICSRDAFDFLSLNAVDKLDETLPLCRYKDPQYNYDPRTKRCYDPFKSTYHKYLTFEANFNTE